MNLLDILLVVIIGASVISGFLAGFARAGVGFLAAVAGILGGFWFYDIPAGWFGRLTDSKTAANLLGFFLIFFAVILLGALVGRVISTAFKWTGLGIVDRLAGAAFGFVRGSFAVVAVVAMLVAFTPRPIPGWMTGSVVLPYAIEASDIASGLAPKALKDSFAQSMKEIKTGWSNELDKARNRAVESIPGMGSFKKEPPPVVVVAPKQPTKKSKTTKAPAAKAKAAKSKTKTVPKAPLPKAVNQ